MKQSNFLNIKSISLISLIYLIIVFVQYYQVIPYEYVLDDKIVISENEYTTKGFRGIKDILTTESFVGYFKEQKDLVSGARYRPLSIITFAVEYGLVGGFNPKLSHIINILLYVFCGILLFYLLQVFFPAKSKAWWYSLGFLATLLWLSHAVHTEVVANIKGRDEIMSLIFSLSAWLFAIRFNRSDSFNLMNWLAILAFFLLGLLSKENTVTFLAIIPASLYVFERTDWKKLLGMVGAMLVAFGIYLGMRISAVGYLFSGKEITDIMNNPYLNLDTMTQLAMKFYVMTKYVCLSIFPYPLTHDYYPFQIPKVGFGNVMSLFGFLSHIGIAIVAIWGLFKKNVWGFLALFYLASISIYSNFVINIGTTMNERFIFVSTIPVCIAIVYLLKWLSKRLKPIALVGVGALVALYSVIAYNRVPAWENSLTLNESAVKVSSNSARANSFMATALYKQAEVETNARYKEKLNEDALVYANKAIEIFPGYYNGNLMKAGIAGELYKYNRDADTLLERFYEVACNRPDIPFLGQFYSYIESSVESRKIANNLNRIAKECLIVKGNFKYAEEFINRALRIDPQNASSNYLMAVIKRQNGDDKGQLEYYNKAVQLDPNIVSKFNPN